MGYVPKKTYRDVDLTGTDLEGEDLHVRLKQMNVDGLRSFARLAAEFEAKRAADDDTFLDVVAEGLADVIHEWDVEDEHGNPVKPTAENIASYDYFEFVIPLFEAVAATVDGTGGELGKGSPNGARSAVDLDLPTEVPSLSPPS